MRPKRNKRKAVHLPPLGQPGGMDDPRRRGLSGAGVRWYLRFLDQGMGPEEARASALERKQQLEERPPQEQQQKKRKLNETTLPEKWKYKKRWVASSTSTTVRPHTSDSKTAHFTKVAVLSSNPEKVLSQEDLMVLEDAIVKEMISGAEHKLKFTGVSFKPGMLVVICADESTVDWLMGSVPQLKIWEGVTLKVCVGENIPKEHDIEIFFPRSKDLSNKDLLALVDSQNDALYTQLWKVISSKEEGSGKLMRITVDDHCLKSIKEAGKTIFYRFGKITVDILEDGKMESTETESAKVETANPAPAPDHAKSTESMELTHDVWNDNTLIDY